MPLIIWKLGDNSFPEKGTTTWWRWLSKQKIKTANDNKGEIPFSKVIREFSSYVQLDTKLTCCYKHFYPCSWRAIPVVLSGVILVGC